MVALRKRTKPIEEGEPTSGGVEIQAHGRGATTWGGG